VLPLKALLEHGFGEAYVHVQGESLKAYAAFLVSAFKLPDSSWENEMARLTFGGCRPKPGQPCPLCGKPVTQMRGRSLLTAFRLADWIVCSGAPRCGYARLADRPQPAGPRLAPEREFKKYRGQAKKKGGPCGPP
jgi:hypothetical protein